MFVKEVKDKKRILVIILSLLGIIFFLFRGEILVHLGVSYRKAYNIDFSKVKINSMYLKLNIVEIQYGWRTGLEYDNNPTMLIYHHTAIKNITPEEINNLHQSKGWQGIGYHYYITKEGTIFSGRPEKAVGAHTKGKNKCSIGIALEGDFEEEQLTKEQIESLIDLSTYLCLKYDICKIIGHNDVSNTLCPGKNFPKNDIREMVIKQVKSAK